MAGLFTTLAARMVPNIFSSRSEREAWERGILDDALTQAVAYVSHLWARVDALTDPQAASRPKPLETSHRDIITARTRLHPPKKIFDAWHDLTKGEDSFWYSLDASSIKATKFPPSIGTTLSYAESIER